MLKGFTWNILFWMGWVVLPLIAEVIPAISNFITLFLKKRNITTDRQNYDENELFWQYITLIIPVYNSSKTLKRCIESISLSNYNLDYVDVILIDNGSKDNSFDIFKRCQLEYPNLHMNYLYSDSGKSKAMNMAIYNSVGKYVINCDSDGVLERNAIYNVVRYFEMHPEVDCASGAVLIEPALIEADNSVSWLLKTFRRLEFIEYCQAFLAGRNFQAERRRIFTMSGAFSAFKRSTIMQSWMYNTETVGEDTNLTFQVKDIMHGVVSFCDDAIFMVDPIEDINKYYTQRQRWQLGEIEVAHQFLIEKGKFVHNVLRDSDLRVIIEDLTLAFPKFIWFGILLILMMYNRNYYVVGIATLLVYIMSMIPCFAYSFNIIEFLDINDELKKYYLRNLYLIPLYPLYSFFGYFVRLCGIVNSLTRKATWKTKNMTEEWDDIKIEVLHTISPIIKFRNHMKNIFEDGDCERIL